ncbi:hypothetical protein [Streptomyces sp. WL006]
MLRPTATGVTVGTDRRHRPGSGGGAGAAALHAYYAVRDVPTKG